LVLTVNRLWSSSRIAAYIGVIFEHVDGKGKWIGWENSLREHRIWIKENKGDKLDALLKTANLDAIPDSMMFYTVLLKFHIAIMAVAIILSGWLYLDSKKFSDLFWFALSLVTITCFIYSCITRYNPAKIYRHIEEQRIIWIEVFRKIDLVKRGSFTGISI